MPQKKNPDLLEYLRGKTGSLYGNFFAMLTILKGLPLSYFKDLQDDKEIIFKSYDVLFESLKIFNEILKNVSPNKKRMLELANIGYTTSTDLADYIVISYGLPFRKAYNITSKIVNYVESKKMNFSSRAAFKLLSIDKKFQILNKVKYVVDLGCAPGSWCEVLNKKPNIKKGVVKLPL